MARAEVRHDLPGGAPRSFQPGEGYRAVLLSGTPTIENDEATGAAAREMLSA